MPKRLTRKSPEQAPNPDVVTTSRGRVVKPSIAQRRMMETEAEDAARKAKNKATKKAAAAKKVRRAAVRAEAEVLADHHPRPNAASTSSAALSTPGASHSSAASHPHHSPPPSPRSSPRSSPRPSHPSSTTRTSLENELAALKAQVKARDNETLELRRQNHKLTKRLREKKRDNNKENDSIVPIPKPKGKFNIQDVMGLGQDSQLYHEIQATIHNLAIEAKVDFDSPWSEQEAAVLNKVFLVARERQPYLTPQRFPKNWATSAILQRFLNNRRSYTIGKSKPDSGVNRRRQRVTKIGQLEAAQYVDHILHRRQHRHSGSHSSTAHSPPPSALKSRINDRSENSEDDRRNFSVPRRRRRIVRYHSTDDDDDDNGNGNGGSDNDDDSVDGDTVGRRTGTGKRRRIDGEAEEELGPEVWSKKSRSGDEKSVEDNDEDEGGYGAPADTDESMYLDEELPIVPD